VGGAVQTKIFRLLQVTFLSVCAAVLCCGRAAAQAPSTAQRITQAIDEKNLVVLKGNMHPLAAAKYDQGAAADAFPLHRILLLLQRGPDQQEALAQFMERQQDRSSPNFHAWLTPTQFGQQFGPSDADIQTVTNWLQSHGFQITNLTSGRTLIEFSGTAGQVSSAFHTEMHNYLVNGEMHTANASDPQIPAALAPVVVGPVALNNFPVASHLRRLGTFHRAKGSALAQPLDKPLYTFSGCTPAGCFGLGPADFATIYNSAPLLAATPAINGAGQTIAVVGESDIDPTDVTDFQTMFGMTPNFTSTNNIIVNGADPGFNGSEGESDLDVQWASAVAPGATVKFVTSQPTETTAGIFLSAIYIVENNFAGVMSESFGGCEQQIGTLNQFHNTLWEQAAAQGISVFLSAGDGGSAGCDNFDTAQAATHGLAVSGFASTPFNVAVGGTDFDEVNRWTQFWSSTNNSANQSSALSYIPEIPWNENCAQLGTTGCNGNPPNGSLNIVAGSGGVSTIYPKPLWQSGFGPGNFRNLPDISLFASAGFDGSFYIVCQKDVAGFGTCNLGDLGLTFQGVGGTSASAPAFAGIMALVNQGQATQADPAPRQGNANYVLYSLFQKQTKATPAINCNSSATPSPTCTFYDVTRGNSALPSGVGTNSVPCAPASPNCSSNLATETNGVLITAPGSTTEAYTVAAGYDLATGLGSVNIANLVNNWSSALNFKPSNTTLTAALNGQTTSSITGAHGTPVNLSSTVSPAQGTGTPTGAVSLLATPNPTANAPGASLGFDVLTLSAGTATGTNVILPGGQYSLTAHYQGDGTFGSSDSTPPISVSISAEPSKTLISIPTFNSATGSETGNTPTSLVYGSSYLARIDVGKAQASLSFPPQAVCTPPACPSGTITWMDSYNGAASAPLDSGTFALNTAGFTEDQVINLPAGAHALSASYGGDSSFGTSNATYALTVTQAPTNAVIAQQPGTVVVGTQFQIVIGGNAQTLAGVAPTGAVTFFDGTTQLGSPVVVTGTPSQGANPPSYTATGVLTLTTGGTHVISAKYSGDTNYAPSSAGTAKVTALYATTTTVTLSSTEIPYGASVTATVTVTTNVKTPVLSGRISLSVGNTPSTILASTVSTDANGNTMMTATATTTPQGPEGFNANYEADNNFNGSMGFVSVQVDIPDFSFTAPTAPLVIPAGQTGSLSFTVTPVSMTSSTVALTCGPGFLAGYVCNFQPGSASLTDGTAANETLMLNLQSPQAQTAQAALTHSRWGLALASSRPAFWPPIAGLALLAACALPLWPGKRPALCLACGVVMAAIGLFVGCGGGPEAGGLRGPTATTTTVTSNAAKVGQFVQVTLTATVTGPGNPVGNVTFVGNGSTLTTVPLNNGTATVTTPFFEPGVYSVTAQYSGDGFNNPSSSSPITELVTGTLTFQIVGQTGTLSHTANVQVTVQ
jgi:hypothetical protein